VTESWKILGTQADECRIVDNAHLLDATEIFRKLNVHKKVKLLSGGLLNAWY
jgi:hypothetical protein